MPRKLLRIALVAAVLPALTPEVSSAQTAKVAPATVRTTAPATAKAAAPKKGLAGLWQKVRGQKPEAAPAMNGTSARIVRVSSEQPAAAAPAATDRALELERAQFENPFPDDTPVRRRSAAVAQEVATPVEAEVATPVEPDAFPIEGAAPPADMTAEYNAPQGDVPQYDRTGMYMPETPANDVTFAQPVPARPTGNVMNGMNGGVGVYQTPPPAVVYGAPGIARVDGAMYPSPQPGIPAYVGQTMITNPALDPHEMLYAHSYRGLYGPFYHKTQRHWVLTPFGICKTEKRTLMGTEVRVNYKSHIGWCSLFFPPVTH